MPAEPAEKWLKSRRLAQINGLQLRPLAHPRFKSMPLSIQRGQAEAFCLTTKSSQQWILKKFLEGKALDRKYLEAVTSLLPKDDGFLSGTDRQILSTQTLAKGKGCYYTVELAQWLDGTILMPKIVGIDWATLADKIRDGGVKLEPSHRLGLCQNLTRLVYIMEQLQLTHRDLSSGNVFIIASTWAVCLIDFDSLYHQSLPMPETTTCGTAGYTPPFAWRAGALDPEATWCICADRFALAVLNVEFLILDQGAPLTAEGGMFDQEELRHRSGKDLNSVFDTLMARYPAAVGLFKQAVESKDSNECPSPEDWLRFCDSTGMIITPPRLDELENIPSRYFESLLEKQRPAAPLWPAPHLGELPTVTMSLPKKQVPVVQLPPDPWSEI